MSAYRDHYSDKVVLVTGGAGSIGNNLVRAIAGLGAKKVIILDDLSSGFSWNVPLLSNVELVKGSVVSEADLKSVFAMNPDIVFHLAAFFANQNSIDHPKTDLMTNGLGTLLTFQYSQSSDVQRVVFASSGCSIYGPDSPFPLKEEYSSMRLSTPYQVTKMLGELYANFFSNQYGLPIVKARLFNSFGPGEVPGQYRNVIPNFIFLAIKGKPLPFTASSSASRDFTFVGDVVDALLRAGYFEAAVGKEINIASGREVRVRHMAELVNEMTGNEAGVISAPKRLWDNKERLLASIDRAQDLLGYEPRMSFDEGLATTVDWFRENWSRIDRDAKF